MKLLQVINKSVLLIGAVILIVFVYSSGITGSLYYDDFRPLGNLKGVTNLNSALFYIFTEISGPLGRPISMLTFLTHVNQWPDNIPPFFIFNIILHGLNTLAVFAISYFLAFFYQQRFPSTQTNISPYWLALLTAVFWAILPLHVSSSLIAIQRMTTLSAFFVLAGIAIYLYGLHKQYLFTKKTSNTYNNTGLNQQITGLILFTLLAMFSKENGILLPVFIFILEITLLSGITQIEHRRKLRVFSTFSGLLVILAYLLYTVLGSQEVYIKRDFDLFERVLTQSIILLDYLKLAFIPEVSAYNPFHDDYPVFRSITPAVAMALLFWSISLLLACKYRKANPLAAFAILWFLAAHLLESTVIGLELYYEHRNYIALLGPCLALMLSINYVHAKYIKLVIISFNCYLILILFSLYQTTTLWGNPEKAAQAWFLKQPGSVRAAQRLSDIYLEHGQPNQALDIINVHLQKCPNCIASKAQAMLITCSTGDNERTKKYYHDLLVAIKGDIHFANTHGPLSILQQHIEQGHCTALNYNHLKKINNILLERNDLTFDKRLALILNLHQIALAENDQEENIRLLTSAWHVNENVEIAQVLMKYQIDNKKYQEAKTFIYNELCTHKETNQLQMNKFDLACKTSKQLIQSFITKPSGDIKANEK